MAGPPAADDLRSPPARTLQADPSMGDQGDRAASTITRLRALRPGGWHTDHARWWSTGRGQRHRLVLRRAGRAARPPARPAVRHARDPLVDGRTRLPVPRPEPTTQPACSSAPTARAPLIAALSYVQNS
jgi:hypothetical protein